MANLHRNRMMKTLRHAALFLLACTTMACGRGQGGVAPAAAPRPPEPFPAPQRLYYDNGGGIQDSLRLVIRDAATMQSRWTQATSRQASPPPAPDLDFNREMAVLVSSGRMTPDDRVHVDSAAVTRAMDGSGAMGNVLLLYVRTVRGCRPSSTQAYPVEILRMRRFDGTVRFQETTERAEGCQ